MTARKNNLVVIAGPTAVGKTRIAIEVARHFSTEIISVDSRQFFRELNIGTAKPSLVELEQIPHHFVNSHSISEKYDAAQFAEDALDRISTLFSNHDYLIVCGGSGLYIKALIEGFDDIPEVSETIREELNEQFKNHGLKFLQQRMMVLDPEHFSVIDNENPHRLIRALEVKIATGLSISSFQKKKKLEHDFTIKKVGLELPREQLYQRIDQRMDHMIEAGLFEEARTLLPYKSHQALQTVGYQEIFGYFDGLYDKDEAIRLLKRNSRRYAKRQLTWFKRDAEMKWFYPDDLESIINYITVD
jgi:tRNA dimethylallyltransferase